MNEIINLAYLYYCLMPIRGSQDDDELIAQFESIDDDDEWLMRDKVIRPHFIPFYFQTCNDQAKDGMKSTLNFLIVVKESSFPASALIEEVFDSMCSCFPLPSEPRNLIRWIWKESFPCDFQEDYCDNRFALLYEPPEPFKEWWNEPQLHFDKWLRFKNMPPDFTRYY